jgi:hypothetical protein
MEKELRIRLRMEGELLKRYTLAKERLGLKDDNEAIRALINWYWEEQHKSAGSHT